MTISVVIPTKNRVDVLPRAIRSVAAQTVGVDELIVVDDGSDDDTPSVVEQLRTSIPQLRLIQLPSSRGAPTARNTGAEAATGELIALLDSDDVWKPQKLERQLSRLAQSPLAPGVFSGFEFHYAHRGMRVSRTPSQVRREDLFIRNVLGGSSSALIRRNAWFEAGGFNPSMRSCQDWDFWLRLSALGPLVAVPDPLVEYHFDGDGRISRNRGRVEDGHNRIFELIEQNVPVENRRRVRAYHAIRMAEIYAEQCFDPAETVRNAVQAAWSGRSYDTSRLAARAVGKMVMVSLDRMKRSGSRQLHPGD